MICAGIILFFGIDYLKGINIFNPSNYYYVLCENVFGLDKSASVTINGYKVGQVRDIIYDYENPGKVKVILAVNDKLHLPVGSYAEMSSTLLSGSYVVLHLSESSEMIPSGQEIPLKEGEDLMDIVKTDIMPSVNSILPRVDSILYNLNTLVADPGLTASIQRLDGITDNVYGITKGLSKTVNGDVPVVMRNARNVTDKLDSIGTNLIAISNSLKALPLATTVDNVNAITENLTQFSRQLNDKNSTLGLLTRDPELYNRLNTVVADIDSLIIDIKKNPKRYISIKLL